ncbi:hypothetical protein [Burkholderia thailandensis]|uniref:hypothetical protein n=1 Tax=Burkholderia thailandensis TaxID=57975 RepID=UPI001378A3AB|nr:hypothetical protein [Burkholderia thailandensis]MCS6477366.1 helix-turn-helix domain-containing protein [Burkholderia thailandensis]MCS6511917.1 helix-turn-helix domain-containing protein [Burkholderia thailandensis]NBD05261.1 hypothetical protein [Burkholderia thailandensis]NOK53999.1 hypothetical protein [Burkholderia thailandensis]
MHQNAIKAATIPDRRRSVNEPPRPVLLHADNRSDEVESARPWSGTSAHTSPASNGREYLTTEEAADLLGLRPQTLRKAYSSDGCYFSIVPKKAANRRLYWRADLVRALIEGA